MGKLTINYQLLVAAVFLIAIAILNVFWIYEDTRLQPVIDEYVLKTITLTDGLIEEPLHEYPRQIYRATIGPRPPLYQLLSTPFMLLIERSADSMLFVNSLAIILLGLATFRIGQIVHNSNAGLIGCVLVTCYPVLINFSRIARPHSVLPAFIALSLLAMIIGIKRPTIATAWMAALSILLAFSVHAYSLNLLFGATFLFLLYTVFFRNAPHRPSYTDPFFGWIKSKTSSDYFKFGVLPAFTTLGVIFVFWMVLKWEQFLGLRSVIQKYFSGNKDAWFYLTSMNSAISTFGLILFLVSLVYLTFRLCKSSSNRVLTLFLILSLVSMFLVATFGAGAKSWSTFGGSLGLIASISAVGLVAGLDDLFQRFKGSAHIKTSRSMVMAAVPLIMLSVYAAYGWGLFAPRGIQVLTGASQHCTKWPPFCPNPPRPGNWKIPELLSSMVSDNHCVDRTCDVALVSHRQEYFSDESLRYSLKQYYPREDMRFSRIGHMKHQGDTSNWLHSDYVIYTTGVSGYSENYNISGFGGLEYEEEIIAILENPDFKNWLFQKIYSSSIPTGEMINVVKVLENPDLTTATEIITQLNLETEIKERVLRDLKLYKDQRFSY